MWASALQRSNAADRSDASVAVVLGFMRTGRRVNGKGPKQAIDYPGRLHATSEVSHDRIQVVEF